MASTKELSKYPLNSNELASMPVDINFAKKGTVIDLLAYSIRLSKKAANG